MKKASFAVALICLTALYTAPAAPKKSVTTETNAADTVDASVKPGAPARLYDAAHPAPNAATVCTIYMIGDSTMSNKPLIPAYPERGWGQLFSLYFQSGVRIENHAMNGRSSKSFIGEGRWKTVRDELKPGDWVIIQFGHNDNKPDTNRFTEPFGSFKTNLMMYVEESKARGAHPLLCTSIARRKFDADGKLVDTHGDYIVATRQVATEEKIPLLDLNKRTDELLRQLGDDRSKMLYDWVTTNDIPGMKTNLVDDTHLNAFGASRVCDMAVAEIRAKVPELVKFLNTGK